MFAAGASDGSDLQAEADFQNSRLRQYWEAITVRKWFVLALGLAGVIAGIVYASTQTRTYEAQGLLEIVGANQNFLNARDLDPLANPAYTSDDYIQTQVDILRSHSLVDRALSRVHKTDHSIPADDKNGGRQPESPSGTSGGQPHSDRISQRSQVAGLKVAPRRGSHLIDIECTATDPAFAADFVNTLMTVFLEYSLEFQAGPSKGAIPQLNSEMEALQRKVQQSESELQAYARSNELMFTDDKGTVAEEKLRQLQVELAKAQAERIEKQSQYEIAKSGSPEAVIDVLNSGALKDDQAKLADLRRQLSELRASFTPEFYKVKRVQAQIDELESLIHTEQANVLTKLNAGYDTAVNREKLLSAEFAAQTRLVSGQAVKAIYYNILKGQADTYRKLYEDMLQKVRSASIASALRPSTARIVDPAERPTRPSRPNPALDSAGGSLIGLLLGATIVISRRQQDRTVTNPSESVLYAKLPELGIMPSVDADPMLRGRTFGFSSVLPASTRSRKAHASLSGLEMVAWNHKPSLLAEAARYIVASILFSGKQGQSPRVVALSSPGPGDGKSTITCNLGIALAETGRKVLLVDADTRRPKLQGAFNISGDRGLTNILAGTDRIDEASIESTIFATEIPGLSVLPAGTSPEPISTLLYSPRFAELLRLLRLQFNTILIDTPPVLHFSETRIIARLADTNVIVVRAGKTTRDALQGARQRFESDGTPVLGTILNDWRPVSNDHYSYYYQSQVVAEQSGESGSETTSPDPPQSV